MTRVELSARPIERARIPEGSLVEADVVFLDVRLGRTTAFEIIEGIGVDSMPIVVFVAAYDRHALKAFEVHALDYVLKPVDPERLREAVDRAVSQLALRREASLAERLEGLLAQQPRIARQVSSRSAPERLVVRDGERLLFVETEQIDWIESAGNYVRIHRGGRANLMRTTMSRIVRRLDGLGTFVRVRRSAIINIRAVANMERYGKGTYVLHLRGGAKVISSRYYQPALREVLRQYG